jgi:hypothetical protein
MGLELRVVPVPRRVLDERRRVLVWPVVVGAGIEEVSIARKTAAATMSELE